MPGDLPALRMGRVYSDLRAILNTETTGKVMDVLSRHLEEGAVRWGAACPVDKCLKHLEQRHGHPWCSEHGSIRDGVVLLIGFYPVKTTNP